MHALMILKWYDMTNLDKPCPNSNILNFGLLLKKVAAEFQKSKFFVVFAHCTKYALSDHGMSYTVGKLHLRAFK